MKKLLNIILFVSFILLLEGCKCGSCEKDEEVNIPLNIIEKGNQIISSKTGDDFFQKYIKINNDASKKLSTGYYLVYNFTIPDKAFINEKITVEIDSAGNLDTNKELYGIPDCSADVKNCTFTITEKEAKDIAIKAGLGRGVKEWKIDFMWNSKVNKYVWYVLSTDTENKGSNGYTGNGVELLIDPADGSIVQQNKWYVR